MSPPAIAIRSRAEELEGSHPALHGMLQSLSERRQRLHEDAHKRHAKALTELSMVRQAENSAVWTWWTAQRDGLHWNEFNQTWTKRRRLNREKTEIEMPRPGECHGLVQFLTDSAACPQDRHRKEKATIPFCEGNSSRASL